MSSSIPYDPDENPFANERSRNSVVSGIGGDEAANDGFQEALQDTHEGDGQEAQPTEQLESSSSGTHIEETTANAPHTPGLTDTAEAPDSTPTAGDGRKIKKYKLITKVTGIERQGRKDPIIKMDAYTTLPRFRTTTYRDIRRTHHEFEKFFEYLDGNNPECFVPSLPPATSSAGAGTDEDEFKTKTRMQLWLDRVTANPILARDEEFVHFIESSFGYTPVVHRSPPATGLARRAIKQLAPPPDEVVELAQFRPLVKLVYQTTQDMASHLERATKSERMLGLALTDFGSKVGQFATLESGAGPAVVNMWKKLSKTVMALGDLSAVKATAEQASLGDGVAWVSQDAYVAKEAMTNRHLLMRELNKAQATTKARHNHAQRVRGQTNLSPVKVDEAILALEDATKTEEQLTNKVRRVSDNMLLERGILLDRFEKDFKSAIQEYALRMIECERKALSSWEAIRLDVRAVDSNGGLSRLGREATPSNRRAVLVQSQGPAGDSWSGDRKTRAIDHLGDSSVLSPSRPKDARFLRQDPEPEEAALDEPPETAVDARNAASLLASSTF